MQQREAEAAADQIADIVAHDGADRGRDDQRHDAEFMGGRGIERRRDHGTFARRRNAHGLDHGDAADRDDAMLANQRHDGVVQDAAHASRIVSSNVPIMRMSLISIPIPDPVLNLTGYGRVPQVSPSDAPGLPDTRGVSPPSALLLFKILRHSLGKVRHRGAAKMSEPNGG